jgi:hypothetical protein
VRFVVPEGKNRVGAPSYQIVGEEAIETYAVEDLSPPDPDLHDVAIAEIRRRFIARALANDATNATVTLANVGLLGFVVAPGEIAYFEFDAIFRSAAGTTGVAFAVSGPQNSTIVSERRIPTSGAAAVNVMNTQQGTGNDATSTATANIDAANTDRLAKISGIVRAGTQQGDGGLVRLRFRSEVAGSTVTVLAGSFVRAWFDEPPVAP